MNHVARTEVIKIVVNPAELEAIRRKCTAAGRSISSVGREILKSWTPGNRTGTAPQFEWPRPGPIRRLLPGRRAGAVIHKRL